MAFNQQLLNVLACPVSKSKLKYNAEENVLVCVAERLVYPIRDDIPVLLETQAERRTLEQIEAMKLDG